ncbi:hypothetical protein [Desulforhabdus amnigena]|uniref:Uncharacterized protein n=1 Tax=Desulforhabdus amnigena TaxID=40218 RepID=A0A9W6FWI6_9BACT|nr:hypothetical protein [Desulforhabdus amnigena]GLI36175.1 hypothetical protein DAMNIGENAA_36080 [Desulforhabdus amnigena]
MSEISLSVITATKPERLSKGFKYVSGGVLQKIPGGQLVEGIIELRGVSVSGFASLLKSLHPGQALTYGVSAHDRARIVTAEALTKTSDDGALPTIARTREHLHWPEGAGILMLDYDPQPGKEPLTPDELRRTFYSVCPELKTAPHVWTASASSCICRTDNGEELRGIMGQRIYIFVQDASDIPRAGQVFFDRLCLAGYDFSVISKSGAFFWRTLIDGAVHQPERLDFAGGAACGPGIEQRRPDPVIYNPDGAFLDTRTALPDLTPDEKKRLAELKRAARAAAKPEADQARELWVEDRLAQMVKGNPDLDRERTRDELTRAVKERRLFGDFQICTEKHGVLTVGQLLDNPKKYHGIRCHDPLEPDYGNDPRIAQANLRTAGKPYIWSFAHGGQRYTLHRAVTTVRIEGGELQSITGRCLELMRLDGTIYERGGELVRLAEGKPNPLSPEWLRWYLTGLIRFEKYDARAGEWLTKDCPVDLAKTVLAMSGSWGLPRLTGIITAPTITPEGRVIDQEGHDEETGLYLDFPDPEGRWRAIPEKPTETELKAAAETVWKPFELFPFVDPVARGSMLAGILTATTRPLLPTAPGCLLTAPSAGSGKTLLALCLAALAGQEPEVYPRAKDDDELRKRFLAAFRGGAGCIIFDNLSGHFESDTLCAVSTTGTITDRILGESSTLTVPANALIVLTGNNVSLVGDLGRRFISVRIDPQMQTPWQRSFPFDPLEDCRTHRLELIRAGLMLLKGFLASGAPKPQDRLASFEAWSDFIRGCVCWIGKNGWLDVMDPVASITENFEADPETSKLAALLDAWHTNFGKDGKTVAQVIRTAEADKDSELWAALDEIAGERGVINSRRLGRWIEKHQGRIVEGLRFSKEGTRQKIGVWKVGLVDLVGVAKPYTENCHVTYLYNGGKHPHQTPKTHLSTCADCLNFTANRSDPKNKPGTCPEAPDGKFTKMPTDGGDCPKFKAGTHKREAV